jgi:hypothetical protein
MGPYSEVIFGEITFEFDALLFGHFWHLGLNRMLQPYEIPFA